MCFCNLEQPTPSATMPLSKHLNSKEVVRRSLSAEQTVAQGGWRVDGIQSSRATEGRFGFTPGCADFRSASHTGNMSPRGMNLQSCPKDFTTELPNDGK